MKEITILCDCHFREHQFTIGYSRDDASFDFLYLDVHLASVGFFYRIWKAIQYVFGYRSRYGDWDEVLVGRAEAGRIVKFINSYLEEPND